MLRINPNRWDIGSQTLTMITDNLSHNRERAGFLECDRIRPLELPKDGRLLTITKSIESAIRRGRSTDVRRTCAEFLDATSEFYKVPACGFRVLAARPLRVRERCATELFGDYSPETMLIRVWMRTAVRKEVTSFGTFVSTLSHEFCPILILRNSNSRTRGTLADSMSEPLRFTIMREEPLPSDCSGCP
jgi:hypothetical protein